MARVWTCQKCRKVNKRTQQLCVCGRRRPKARVPAHKRALVIPYEEWVARYGEVCGICGRGPGTRRLDRDHCHATGEPRGLLCPRCNRALPGWVTPEWLRKAADYLERATGTA